MRSRPLICCTSLIADHTPQPATCGRPVQTLLSATRYRTSQRPRGVTSTRLAYGILFLLTLLHLKAAKPATDVMCCPTHDVISHDGLQIATSMHELAHWPAQWPGGVMVSKQDAATARSVKEGQRSVGWSRITEKRPGWLASPRGRVASQYLQTICRPNAPPFCSSEAEWESRPLPAGVALLLGPHCPDPSPSRRRTSDTAGRGAWTTGVASLWAPPDLFLLFLTTPSMHW